MIRFLIILISIYFVSNEVNAQNKFTAVVAHRAGVWNDPQLPENSIAAMQKCAAIGVNIIEIDVHLTKDNIVIVNHDHDFQGLDIASNTYADLKKHGKLSNGEALSTLKEYISALKKHRDLKLWIDIKRSKINLAQDIRTGEEVANVINQTKSSAIAEVIAPMFASLVKLKMTCPTARLHYIGTDYSPEELKLLGFIGVNLQHKRYNQEYNMKNAQNEGLLIGAYVVDDSLKMKELLSQKVDYITTNKPLILLDVVKNYRK